MHKIETTCICIRNENVTPKKRPCTNINKPEEPFVLYIRMLQ